MSIQTLKVTRNRHSSAELVVAGDCGCPEYESPASNLRGHSRHMVDLLRGETTLTALGCLCAATINSHDFNSMQDLRDLLTKYVAGKTGRTDDNDGGEEGLGNMAKRARLLVEGARALSDVLQDLSDIERLARAVPLVETDAENFSIDSVLSAIRAFFDRVELTVNSVRRSGAGIVIRTADTGLVAIDAAKNIYLRNVYTPSRNLPGEFDYDLREADELGRGLGKTGVTQRLSEERVYATIAETLRETPDVIEINVVYFVSVDLESLPYELAVAFGNQLETGGVVRLMRTYRPDNFSDSYVAVKTEQGAATAGAIEIMMELEEGNSAATRDEVGQMFLEMLSTATRANVLVTPTGTTSERLYRIRRRGATVDDDNDASNDQQSRLVVTLNRQPSTLAKLVADLFPRQLFEAGLRQTPGTSPEDDLFSDDEMAVDSKGLSAMLERVDSDFANVKLGRKVEMRVAFGGDPRPPRLLFTFGTAEERTDSHETTPPQRQQQQQLDLSDAARARDVPVLSNGFVRSPETNKVFLRPPRVLVEASLLEETRADADQITGYAPRADVEVQPTRRHMAYMAAENAVNNIAVLTETEMLGEALLTAEMQRFLDAVSNENFGDRAHLRVTRGESHDVVFAWQSSKNSAAELNAFFGDRFGKLLLDTNEPLHEFEFMAYELTGTRSVQAEFTAANYVGSDAFVSRFQDDPDANKWWISMHNRNNNLQFLAPDFPVHESLDNNRTDTVPEYNGEANRAEFVVEDLKYGTLLQFAEASRFAGMPDVQASFYKSVRTKPPMQVLESERLLDAAIDALDLVELNGVQLDRQSFSPTELSRAMQARFLLNPWLFDLANLAFEQLGQASTFYLVPYPIYRRHAYLPSTTVLSVEKRLSGRSGLFPRIVSELRAALIASKSSDNDASFIRKAVFQMPNPRLLGAMQKDRTSQGAIFLRALFGRQEPRQVLHETMAIVPQSSRTNKFVWESSAANASKEPPRGTERALGTLNGMTFGLPAATLRLGASQRGIPVLWFEALRVERQPTGQMVQRVVFRARQSVTSLDLLASAASNDGVKKFDIRLEGEQLGGGGAGGRLDSTLVISVAAPQKNTGIDVVLESFSLELVNSAAQTPLDVGGDDDDEDIEDKLISESVAREDLAEKRVSVPMSDSVEPTDEWDTGVADMLAVPPKVEPKLVSENVLGKLEIDAKEARKKRKNAARIIDITSDSEQEPAVAEGAIEFRDDVVVSRTPNKYGKRIKRARDAEDAADAARIDEQRERAQAEQTDDADDMALDIDGNGRPDSDNPDEDEELDDEGVEKLGELVAALSVPAPPDSGIITKPLEIEISDHDLKMPPKRSKKGFLPRSDKDRQNTRDINAVFMHPGWPSVIDGGSVQITQHIARAIDDWPEAILQSAIEADERAGQQAEPTVFASADFVFEGKHYATLTHGILHQALEFFALDTEQTRRQLLTAPNDGEAARVYNAIVERARKEVAGFSERFDDPEVAQGRLLYKNQQFMNTLALMQHSRTMQNPGLYRSALALLEKTLESSDQAHLHLFPNVGQGIDETERSRHLGAAAVLVGLSENYIREPPFMAGNGKMQPYTMTRRLRIDDTPLSEKRMRAILRHVRVSGLAVFTDEFFARTTQLRIIAKLLLPLIVTKTVLQEAGEITAEDGTKTTVAKRTRTSYEVDAAANEARAVLHAEGIVSLDFTVLVNRAGETVGGMVSAFYDDRVGATHKYVVLGLQVIGNSRPVINRLLSHAEYNMLNSDYQASSGRNTSTLTGLAVQRDGFVQEGRPATLIVSREVLLARGYEAASSEAEREYNLDPDDAFPELVLSASTHYGRTFVKWLAQTVFPQSRWNLDGRVFPLMRKGRLVLEEVFGDDAVTPVEFRRIDVWHAAPHPFFVSEMPGPLDLARAYPSVRVLAPRGTLAAPQQSTFLSIECHVVGQKAGEKELAEKLLYRSNFAPDWILLDGAVALVPFDNEARSFLEANRELFSNKLIDDDGKPVSGEDVTVRISLEQSITEINKELRAANISDAKRASLEAEKRELATELREVSEKIEQINDPDERAVLVRTLGSDPFRYVDWDPNPLLLNQASVTVRAPDLGEPVVQKPQGTVGELNAAWASPANWSKTQFSEPDRSAALRLRKFAPFADNAANKALLNRLSKPQQDGAVAVDEQRWADFLDKYAPPQPYTKLDSMLVFDVLEPMNIVFSVVEHTIVGGTTLAPPKVVFRSEPLRTSELFLQSAPFSSRMRMERRFDSDGEIEFVNETAKAPDGTPLVDAEGTQLIRTKRLANKLSRDELDDADKIRVEVVPETFGTSRLYEINLPVQNKVKSLTLEFNNNLEVTDEQPQRVAIGAFFVEVDAEHASGTTIKDVTISSIQPDSGTKKPSSSSSRKSNNPKRRIILE